MPQQRSGYGRGDETAGDLDQLVAAGIPIDDNPSKNKVGARQRKQPRNDCGNDAFVSGHNGH